MHAHARDAGNQDELDKLARDPSFKFSSMFEAVKPAGSPPECPAGFTKANTPNSAYVVKINETKIFMECLKARSLLPGGLAAGLGGGHGRQHMGGRGVGGASY
jgi:hypothetical protein